MENLKPERAEIKLMGTMEEGQHILANIIARAYLRTRKEHQEESQPNCKKKDKGVQK